MELRCHVLGCAYAAVEGGAACVGVEGGAEAEVGELDLVRVRVRVRVRVEG